MQTLENGTYMINCQGSPGGSYVGRHPIEDKSLLPKPVLVLPPEFEQPKWSVEKKGDGYLLRLLLPTPALTAEIDGKLYAILMDDVPPEEWIITYRETQNAYTIEKHNKQGGWVAPDKEPGIESQIQIQRLIVLPVEPVQFSPNQLFVFSPVCE